MDGDGGSEDMDGDGDGRSEDMDGDGGSEDMDGDGDGGSEDMDGTIVERNAESVLEALEPNSNLQMLTITQYRGNSFPNWLYGSHLSPPEQLTFLKELSISKCDGIKIFGNDSTNVPFKFLEVLRFKNMRNWEEWLCMEGFPWLKELSIRNCPKLKRALPQQLPSLQKLVIDWCGMLDVSVPYGKNIIEFHIEECGRILINELSPSLKRFALIRNQYVEFSMDHLINCPFLERLELDLKDTVECPSLDLCCYNSLSCLIITRWKFSSLPFSLHLFTHLNHLVVWDCPELESFPMGGFPSNLQRLFIINCRSLEHLPEECGSLYVLDIRNCPLLRKKYEKDGGERWHTISHIRKVNIDGTYQHYNEA